MASTHSPSEALDYAEVLVKYGRIKDTAIAYQVLDEVSKIIWYAAPWSWTLAQMATQTIAANTSDYTISTPSDFEYLHKVVLVDAQGRYRTLKIESFLPTDSVKPGDPVSVSYSGTTLRIAPKPSTTISGTSKLVILYKKTAPEITSSNFGTVGIHQVPDRWWHVYKAGVASRAYLYADDDRSINIKTNPRDKSVEIAGIEAYFQYLVNEMKLKEPMPFEWETRVEANADGR